MGLHIIILAAGEGKRMHSRLPKGLHQLGGETLLARIVATAQALGPDGVHVVHGDERVLPAQLPTLAVNWVLQTEQLGTGHAVATAIDGLQPKDQVLVLAGDVPLISPKTLRPLLAQAPAEGLGLVVAQFVDPQGLGRMIRDTAGHITGIVEERDATAAQRKIQEINAGILTASVKLLKTLLPKVTNKNAQGEYYLTDVIALACAEQCPIVSVTAETPEEVSGVNDRQQLATLERFYQQRAATRLMQQGVTLRDPTRFDLRGTLTAEQDVVIDVNVVIEGVMTQID